eukprot:TRINITY_DN22724_c0_g1_i1.p1 TRINITY_DN22724_c0_g1~~TRINITY_DN22724_c0_g1_i1.p1  ORF type:complete len:445 (-),score=104.87 TRINITY_DN22724_c0_g1_i1:71-1405(-)
MAETPDRAAVEAQLQAYGQDVLSASRAVLECTHLTPQQALGSLGTLLDIVERLLYNLEDPEGSKFQRVKTAALEKKLGKAASLAIDVIQLAGFAPEGEYLVWQGTPVALLSALAFQLVVVELQQRFQHGGARALEQCTDVDTSLGASLALAVNARTRLLSSGANTSSAGFTLVTQAWLERTTPTLKDAIASMPKLVDPPNVREKAAIRLLRRELATRRESMGCRRPHFVAAFDEIAQLGAGFERLCRRAPQKIRPAATDGGAKPGPYPAVGAVAADAAPGQAAGAAPAALQDGEADFEACSEDKGPRPGWRFSYGHLGLGYYRQKDGEADAGAANASEAEASDVRADEARTLLPKLLQCVPACRTGMRYAVLSELIRLAEFPSFFTVGLAEKNFEVSIEALVQRVSDTWSKAPEFQAEAWTALGVGCSVDITHDDCALLWVILM